MRNAQQILARRAVLLQRISRQRGEFGMLSQALQVPAHLVDKALALARHIRRRPLLAGGIAFISLLVFRKRLPIARMTLVAMAVVRWRLYMERVRPVSLPDRQRTTARP